MQRISVTKQEALKFLAGVVRINAGNPPGNELGYAEYMKSVLAVEGIPARRTSGT